MSDEKANSALMKCFEHDGDVWGTDSRLAVRLPADRSLNGGWVPTPANMAGLVRMLEGGEHVDAHDDDARSDTLGVGLARVMRGYVVAVVALFGLDVTWRVVVGTGMKAVNGTTPDGPQYLVGAVHGGKVVALVAPRSR